MLKYEYSITIKVPVEDVFAYMQDIEREREWQPNLREASQLTEGEPGVAARLLLNISKMLCMRLLKTA